MTYIKNLLHKIEDLSIGYHLPKFHILCQNSYRIATIIKLILEPFFSVKKATPRIFFKSAENRAASSLWVGGHRTQAFCARQTSYGFRVIEVSKSRF